MSKNHFTDVKNEYLEFIKEEKVLVLSGSYYHYFGGYHASDYLESWPTEKYENVALDYKSLVEVIDCISRHEPEVIIDQSNRFEEFLTRFPVELKGYQKLEGQPIWKK